MATQDTYISDNTVDGKNTKPKDYEMKVNGNPDLPVVQGSGPITTPGNYPCPGRKDLKEDKASSMNKMKLLSIKKIDLIKVLKEGKTWIWIAIMSAQQFCNNSKNQTDDRATSFVQIADCHKMCPHSNHYSTHKFKP